MSSKTKRHVRKEIEARRVARFSPRPLPLTSASDSALIHGGYLRNGNGSKYDPAACDKKRGIRQ